MRTFYLILILISSNSFGQDCTLYSVRMTFKGEILSKSYINSKIKVPRLEFIRGKNNDAFKDVNEDYTILNNSFEITSEDYSYDLYNFQYSRDYLPLIITVMDSKGTLKVIETKIQKDKFDFKFHRKGKEVHFTFNLGEIIIE